MADNVAFDGFGSNVSGATFCLPHQLVGLLLTYLIAFVHSEWKPSVEERSDRSLRHVGLSRAIYLDTFVVWLRPILPQRRRWQRYLSVQKARGGRFGGPTTHIGGVVIERIRVQKYKQKPPRTETKLNYNV